MKLRLLVCSVLAFSSFGIAHAGPITWDVSGTFDYGGTISGSFTYDADTNVYSAIDLVTTAAVYSPGSYVPCTPGTGCWPNELPGLPLGNDYCFVNNSGPHGAADAGGDWTNPPSPQCPGATYTTSGLAGTIRDWTIFLYGPQVAGLDVHYINL
jgi:hypothetical protein